MSVWKRNRKRTNPISPAQQQPREQACPPPSTPVPYPQAPPQAPDLSAYGVRTRGNSNDPTDIVNTLINEFKAQGVSANDFCKFIGLHKNTVSRWRNGEQECPRSYAFLFKRLIMDLEQGAVAQDLLVAIKNYRV